MPGQDFGFAISFDQPLENGEYIELHQTVGLTIFDGTPQMLSIAHVQRFNTAGDDHDDYEVVSRTGTTTNEPILDSFVSVDRATYTHHSHDPAETAAMAVRQHLELRLPNAVGMDQRSYFRRGGACHERWLDEVVEPISTFCEALFLDSALRAEFAGQERLRCAGIWSIQRDYRAHDLKVEGSYQVGDVLVFTDSENWREYLRQWR